MRARLLIALVALLGLTAFAPAPFLKRKEKLAPAARLEGLWEVVSRNGGRPLPKGTMTYNVRIEPGRWLFERDAGVAKGGAGRVTAYFLKVDANASPPTFDLRRKENDPTPYGRGIYELKGDELRIAYSWSGTRPDNLTTRKAREWLMTLRRAKK
jgi:uncharacterized protein (TIGR03067 family)